MSCAWEKTRYRLLLLGRTGSGKRTTGNWILGKPVFCSKESANPVTQHILVCDHAVVHEKKILVVDTPGLFDTKKYVIQTAQAIQDSLKFLSPGPHAFLIVLKHGAFAKEEEWTFKILKTLFGPKFFNHAIIILTHSDHVKHIKQFLQECEENEEIKSLFDSCRRRIMTINNKEKDREIIQREREKLMLMVGELTENGMQYYQDDISIYIESLKRHVKEWTDTRWNMREIQTIRQGQQEEVKQEQIKRLEEMAYRHEKEKLNIQLTEDELKTTCEKKQWKTISVASKFIHAAMTSFLKLPASVQEAAVYLFSGDDSLKVSILGSEDSLRAGDYISDVKEKSRRGRLEEMSEAADADGATQESFETSLNELIFHLRSSMQTKLSKKRMKCILSWKERAYPDTIIEAVKEIINAKDDGNWKECLQKANASVKMIEIFPEEKLPDKRELLIYIYSYFCPTFVETGDFSKAIGYHDEDWISAVEKLLKTLPEDKYPYETALLYFEISIRYMALRESFGRRKFFKDRSLSAARKAKDTALQLYGTVLFALVEWMSSGIDVGPDESKTSHADNITKERDYFLRVAFSMERSVQLAQCMDDKVATKLIQTILQIVEIRCKRPYLQEIDHWMKRRLSKPIKSVWIHTKEEEPFNTDTEHSDETESLVSGPYGLSSHQFEVANAIHRGDNNYLQQYLENQKWENEEELHYFLNYSLALCHSEAKQTLVKIFLSWICKECVKLHQPYNVSVWAACISREQDVNEIPVLVCNYWEVVDKKFRDSCFFGLPVIYQEYNTVNEEEIYVQSRKTFLESALTPIDAIQANEIISLNTDWLMRNYSNLEVIKPCPVRSVGLEVKKETCIVLYCRMKGFIPFGEKPFPKTLYTREKSLPVDVREGFYVPAMFQENTDVINVETPWDSHLFRMGLSMGPFEKEISATVGPFVQMEGNNVGFLTCAHAFGVPCNIRTALGTPVVQPAKGEFAPVNPVAIDDSVCGYVDKIAFDIDPNNPVNVDAALIRLQPEKVPHMGRFAWMNPRCLEAAGLRAGQCLSFDHGEIIMKENVDEILSKPGKIIKVGARSGVTSSNLFDPGRVVIRIGEAELSHEHGHKFLPISGGTRCYVMKGQYLIRSRPINVFLSSGDSGAGVFYMDELQKLRCIGIAIGFLSNTFEAVVTPIEDVLRALELDESALMRFHVHYIYRREHRQ